MRSLVVVMTVLLLLGCVAEQPVEPAENVTENVSEEIAVENVSETPEINESEVTGNGGKESFVEVDEVNETNESVEMVPEAPKELPLGKQEGIFFAGGKYVLIMEDVVWYGDKSCAAIRIAYAEGETLKRDVICPYSDYYWHSPGGQRYRIRVGEVAAGYGGERWAEIYIYG